MALKATIYKATLDLSDLDRNVYAEYPLTIARHPSETDERMMIRLLAYALQAPESDDQGALELAKDMWEADEPALWQKDLTGRLVQWIEVGQPDEKRLLKASANAGRVAVYSFSSSTGTWWKDIQSKIERARNLTVWQVPSDQSRALASLAQRTMKLQVTVQEGAVWVADADRSIEVSLIRLLGER